MAILPILRMGNPVLRTPAGPVSPEVLAEAATQQLIDDMIETMHGADGVGLAAPQIGVDWQLFVYQAEDEDYEAGGIPLCVLVNPMVEPAPGELVFDWEGCLSIPDLRGLVPRHPAVRVRGLELTRALRGACMDRNSNSITGFRLTIWVTSPYIPI